MNRPNKTEAEQDGEFYAAIIGTKLHRASQIDSDDAEYVIRQIREDFVTGSSCTAVLCGAETPHRKFVDWDIKTEQQTAVGNATTCETALLRNFATRL